MSQQTLTEGQLRERGLAGLAELARLDEQTGSIHAVAARALGLVSSLLDADRAAVCALEGDATIEWLAQRRLEQLIAASADLRPSDLAWASRPLEHGRPEVFDRRKPDHERSALSDTADAMGMAAFAIVPLRSGTEFTGIPPSGKIVMVVDDEPSIRETLRRALARAGHDVIVAGSGAEALAELANRPVDLLLIGHRMSAMDGTEVYEKAVSLRPELRGKAMLMTGDTLNPALAAFADEHSLRLQSKPFDIDDLVAAVAEQLEDGKEA